MGSDTQMSADRFLHKELSHKIMGGFFKVRNEYGSGHKETIYGNLLVEYLNNHGLKVEKEKSIKIFSNQSGKFVGLYKPDLVVDDKVIIEIKSSRFTPGIYEKQLYSYLKNSNYELGYLVNFGSSALFVKRMIFT